MWDVWIHILGIWAECACWGVAQVCRPYKRKGDLSPHPPPSGAPSPQGEGLRAGEDTRPCGDCGRKTAGAQCAPLRHNYKRLYIQEKGQVWNLSLKTQRRNAVSQNVLLPTFLSRKVGGETQFRIKFLWFLSFSKKGTALFLLDVHHQAHPAGVAAALKLGV